MTDPNEIRAWLKTVPFQLLADEFGKRIAQRRQRESSGRPKVLSTCTCGFTGGAREMRSHKCPKP